MDRQIKHISFLDHVRGFAVILVLVFHAFGAAYGYSDFPWGKWHRDLPASHSAWILAPLTLGWCGVPVFFVVSGFCIHLSFARRPEWKEFFIRRFFRIYPPYLAALLFFALLFPTTKLHLRAVHDVVQLSSHLVLLHNLGNSTFFGIDSSWWSIAVEAQLYLIYPLLWMLAARVGWKRALVASAVVEIALRIASTAFVKASLDGNVLADTPKLLVGCPFFYWFSWASGAYLAEEYMAGRALPFRQLSIPLVVGAIITAEIITPFSVFTFTLFSLLSAMVLARMLDGMPVRVPSPVSRMLAQVGIWSYSLYLIHQPLVDGMAYMLRNRLTPSLNHPWCVLLFLALGLFIILPVAAFWYRCFELPAIGLGKRFTMSPSSCGKATAGGQPLNPIS